MCVTGKHQQQVRRSSVIGKSCAHTPSASSLFPCRNRAICGQRLKAATGVLAVHPGLGILQHQTRSLGNTSRGRTGRPQEEGYCCIQSSEQRGSHTQEHAGCRAVARVENPEPAETPVDGSGPLKSARSLPGNCRRELRAGCTSFAAPAREAAASALHRNVQPRRWCCQHGQGLV